VQAFCVEAGRSYPRGGELSTSFQVSSAQLPTRGLKLAALHRRSQNEIWSGIAQTQANLSRNIGNTVRAPQSQTSLQLTLEHPRLQQAAQAFIGELSPRIEQQQNPIGYVAVVNGKICSADVYGSSELFRSLWPKLIHASAVEALAEPPATGAALPDVEAVQAFLTDAERGQAYRQTGANGLQLIRQDSPRAVLLEAYAGSTVVHRCYLAK
jgi:hypothetical protein